MIRAFVRWLGVRKKPRKRGLHKPSLKDLALIRNRLLQAIDDCLDPHALRLRARIEAARTPQELWLLRNDAFQLISQRHNQSVAAERINALIHIFEGWLEPRQLVRIQ